MAGFDQAFCEAVSRETIEAFKRLGKNGKPTKDEWTVLSSIVKAEAKRATGYTLEVVAMATGSKCLGGSELPQKGDQLHDSHAEVVARRVFKLYLLEQLKRSLEGTDSIFLLDNEKGFSLKRHVTFHFFSSNTPCGDASIFPKEEEEDLDQASFKRKSFEEERLTKKIRTYELDSEVPQHFNEEEWRGAADMHRTGAKCALNEALDPKDAGLNYHVTGALRTKPGRGDQTLSHSCSDKMFKWTVLGLQGALLMLFLDKPVYLETVTIGSCPFDYNALHRALYARFQDKLEKMQLVSPFRVQTPTILRSRTTFPFAKPVSPMPQAETKPCAASLIWSRSATHGGKAEVSVGGKRLGTTKKNFDSYKSRVSICRMELLRRVLEVLGCVPEQDKGRLIRLRSFTAAGLLKMSYEDVKASSIPYQIMWGRLREHVLSNWTRKPAFVKCFSLDEV